MISSGASPTPLRGLVLAGGRSTRMKQDKALLELKGKALVEQAYGLLAEFLPQVFISCREKQWPEETFPDLPKLYDNEEDRGPMGGLLSAISRQPDAAWLVIACDTPLLDHAAIQHLIQERDTKKDATTYRSTHDDAPEPLCAIYEPTIWNSLRQHHAQNKQSLRDVLREASIHLLDLPDSSVLDNINTPEAFEVLRQQVATS